MKGLLRYGCNSLSICYKMQMLLKLFSYVRMKRIIDLCRFQKKFLDNALN